MKKILAFLLVVVMAACMFAACDQSETIVVGYTVYKPMNYTDDNGEFVGFDTDLAKAVFEKLGYKVIFKEIDWNNKYQELNSGNIDCIWNGFTANSSDPDGVERSEKVINLFNEYILPQFKNRHKVRIVCSDAFHYAEHIMPSEKYDYAFVDTWRDASDGAPMYCRMKPLEALSPNTEFSYWIEKFIISRLRAEKFVKLSDLYRAGMLNMTFDEVIEELTSIDKLIKC